MSPKVAGSKSKFTPENLLPIFRKAAKFRDKLVELGSTDNGKSILSAERILDMPRQWLNCPDLNHINNLDQRHDAELFPTRLDIWN